MGTDHQFGAHGRRTPSGVAIGDSLVTSATLGSSASSVRSAAKSAAEWVCACRGTWLWAGPDRQAGEQSGCAQAGEGQQGGPQPGGEVGRAQVAAGGGEDRGGGGDAEDPADVLEGGADTAGQSDLRGGDRAGTPRPWSGRSGRRRFRPATTGLAGAGSCWLVPRPPPAGPSRRRRRRTRPGSGRARRSGRRAGERQHAQPGAQRGEPARQLQVLRHREGAAEHRREQREPGRPRTGWRWQTAAAAPSAPRCGARPPAKAAARTAPPANRASTSADPHPAAGPRSSASVTANTAPVASASPAGSSRRAGPRLSASTRPPAATRTTPTGTFSQNTHCQASPCTVASRPIMNPAIDPATSVTRWRGAVRTPAGIRGGRQLAAANSCCHRLLAVSHRSSGASCPPAARLLTCGCSLRVVG